jgi:hypothetical protein
LLWLLLLLLRLRKVSHCRWLIDSKSLLCFILSWPWRPAQHSTAQHGTPQHDTSQDTDDHGQHSLAFQSTCDMSATDTQVHGKFCPKTFRN